MKEETRNTEVQINKEETGKSLEKEFRIMIVKMIENKEEIGKSLEKQFRIMIVKMIENLENKMEEMQESINKDLEELKNKHTNNTITELKIL